MLVVAAVLVVRACGPTVGTIGKRNHEILDAIPPYPGGARVRLVDIDRETSILPGFSGPTTGRETFRHDRMPAGALQPQVLAWYTSHLSDWRVILDRGGCIKHYSRGAAGLMLSACGDPVVREVRMQVDSNQYG